MRGILSRWVLARVVRSGLAFEEEAIRVYQELRSRREHGRGCPETLDASLCQLLAEEEEHRRILQEIASGKLSPESLENALNAPLSSSRRNLRPLDEETLAHWGQALSSALEQEEKTWIFYGNLRRMSKIPAVRKAFEVLAAMEKEHVDVLRRLLGRP